MVDNLFNVFIEDNLAPEEEEETKPIVLNNFSRNFSKNFRVK